jgi:hypothetical protein
MGPVAACPPRPTLWQLAIEASACNWIAGALKALFRGSRSLLFAPRLMLERGLQFTERRSLKPNDA